MSETIAQLRAMTDEDLIERHDHLAETTTVGTGHYLDELRRRDAARSEKQMIAMTEQVRLLTWAIAALTALNAALIAWTLLR